MSHTSNGTYTVRFRSSLGSVGAGVIELEDLTVKGGDSAFIFSGKFQEQGDTLVGKVSVRQHSGYGMSIFGPLSSFVLELKGQLVSGRGVFSGYVSGKPNLKVTVELQRANLVAAE
ncbi:type III secretion system (T3SS) negative regulator GrlR [Rhodobacter maris]|uniref:Type III secretion system (T3SS) negative regulator GrlR n=1 Tax=Rhodobacter maris TaxID=446682 RepID=A0A285T1L7_9RHOB|nr:type III secretion system (T3SS) negative regulator GrlR [Rhodobacter maris]